MCVHILYMHTGKICNHDSIQLVDGGVSYEGRVEYCNDGVWGTVCDHGWTELDAAVACRQLGLSPQGEFSIACLLCVPVSTYVNIPNQVQWPLLVLCLDGGVVKYFWLMWNAVERRCHWTNAQVVMLAIATTGKMQGSDAVVRYFIHFPL